MNASAQFLRELDLLLKERDILEHPVIKM